MSEVKWPITGENKMESQPPVPTARVPDVNRNDLYTGQWVWFGFCYLPFALETEQPKSANRQI